MKFFFKIGISILCVLFVFSACSFGSEYSDEFFAMDTIMTISAYGKNSRDAVEKAEQEINRLDGLLSVHSKYSEIYRLNNEKTAELSQDSFELVKRSIEISKSTYGAFDITTEPISRLWGFYSDMENKIPDDSEIKSAISKVGIEHIKTDNNTVTLDKNTSIDLGGIAKGYASARTAEILKENGITSAIISLGGNVRAVGTKPDGSKWIAGIANPDDTSKQLGTIAVSDEAVVTSGGYQRCFEENGKIYHHIINPKTGYSAESGLKSVTVVSDDDTLADALSTALFVMGIDKSTDFYRENNNLFGAVLVTDDNKIYVTENIADRFSAQSGYEVIQK